MKLKISILLMCAALLGFIVYNVIPAEALAPPNPPTLTDEKVIFTNDESIFTNDESIIIK